MKISSKFFSFAVPFFALSLASGLFALPTKSPDTLVFWAMPNGPESQRALERQLHQFTRETGKSVRLEIIDWSEAFPRIRRALTSENPPDVLQLGSSWVSYFSAERSLLDLSKEAFLVDTSRFLPVTLQTAEVEGKRRIYAFPWFIDVRALFVNERIADSLGIGDSSVADIPSFLGTLDFIAQAQFLNSAGFPVVPFGIPAKDDWTGNQQLAPFVWNAGGSFIKERDSVLVSNLLDPNTLKGISEFVQILRSRTWAPFSQKDNSSLATQRFLNGEQAILVGTSEILRKLDLPVSEHGLKDSEIGKCGIRIFPFPAGDSARTTFIGGSELAIPARTKRQADARKLLLFLLRANNVDYYTKRIGFLPPDESLLRVRKQDVRYRELIGFLKTARTFPNIPAWAEIENALIDMTNEIGALYRNPLVADSSHSGILADILIKYDTKIDKILNAPTDPSRYSHVPVALADTVVAKPFVPQAAPRDSVKEDATPRLVNAWNIILLIIIITALIVILMSRKHTFHNVRNEKNR